MTAPDPRWQGINHLALVTDDMDTTVRFWHQVLGADLIATIGNSSFRHYFFRVGDGQTVAFFEYQNQPLDRYAKPAGIPYPQASQFDHLSLGLPDEEALLDLRRRLKEYGCEVTDVVDHGFIHSIYFSDPTGIALEASCWTRPMPAEIGDPGWFADKNPVPAVTELAETGTIANTPVTELVDDIERLTAN